MTENTVTDIFMKPNQDYIRMRTNGRSTAMAISIVLRGFGVASHTEGKSVYTTAKHTCLLYTSPSPRD